MSTQPLFCLAEDRHRAVLIAGCLADMGNPVQQLESPSSLADLSDPPALVLWTRRAAQTQWLRQLQNPTGTRSHLCPARSREAALAWFRVLSPALQRSVLQNDCVRALLARPEFAGLEAEFQA